MLVDGGSLLNINQLFKNTSVQSFLYTLDWGGFYGPIKVWRYAVREDCAMCWPKGVFEEDLGRWILRSFSQYPEVLPSEFPGWDIRSREGWLFGHNRSVKPLYPVVSTYWVLESIEWQSICQVVLEWVVPEDEAVAEKDGEDAD